MQVCVCVGWTVALGLHYLLIFGMYPYYRDGRISMSTEMDALYNATHRTIWAIGLAWIVYACAHGLGGMSSSLANFRPDQTANLLWIGFQTSLLYPLRRLFYFQDQ